MLHSPDAMRLFAPLLAVGLLVSLPLPSPASAYGGRGMPPEMMLNRANPRQPTYLRTQRGVLVPRMQSARQPVQPRARTQSPPRWSTPLPVEGKEAGTASITLERFMFSPAKITVKRGAIVTWRNLDDAPHTVTGEGGRGPQSDRLQKGATFSYVFLEEGMFPYFCTPHPFMRGVVEVTP